MDIYRHNFYAEQLFHILQYDFAVEHAAIKAYEEYNLLADRPSASSVTMCTKATTSSFEAASLATVGSQERLRLSNPPSLKKLSGRTKSTTSYTSTGFNSTLKPVVLSGILEPSRAAVMPKVTSFLVFL